MDLGGGADQDLGADFSFETDPSALQSILNLRGLTPKLAPIVQQQQATLTPASHLPKRYRQFEDRYDFFEGKNGTVFYRPSARFARPDPGMSSMKKNRSGGKVGGGGGGPAHGTFRGFERGLNLGQPKRLVQKKSPTPNRRARLVGRLKLDYLLFHSISPPTF